MSNDLCKHYFENVAAKICELWKAEQYDEFAFSNIAYRVLTVDPPNTQLSFSDAVRYGCFTYPLPLQGDIEATFGQPPLTVYWQPDFRIDVLFWVEGFTAIHQHAFSGAFHVMEGSSLHTVWDFRCEERVDTQLLFGQLKLEKAELLTAGATRPIVAGKPFIHATYHLDRPTVSVVVRTNGEKHHLPQYNYLPPSIAYQARDIGSRTTRHLQLLRLLNSARRYDELIDILLNLLENSSDHSAFHYLLRAFNLFKDNAVRELILSWASKKHGRLVEVCRPVLINVDRANRIKRMGERMRQPDLQYFIALLLNIPRRDEIFDLIRARYPDGDPVSMIVGWMSELSRLGLEDVTFPETWLESLRSLLRTTAAPQSVQTISARREQESTAARMQEAEEFSEAVSNHWLLQPLFV